MATDPSAGASTSSATFLASAFGDAMGLVRVETTADASRGDYFGMVAVSLVVFGSNKKLIGIIKKNKFVLWICRVSSSPASGSSASTTVLSGMWIARMVRREAGFVRTDNPIIPAEPSKFS